MRETLNYQWTAENIRRYREAGAYTGFYKKLSELAEPWLDVSWTLADLGCGPGLFDFFLAPMVSRITAIDNDEAAIDSLRAETERVLSARPAQQPDTAGKIRPVLRDFGGLGADERWDAVLLAFVGVDARLLDSLIERARKRALIFVRPRPPIPDEPEVLGVPETERHLAKRGYSFEKITAKLEFGQPFRSLHDAEAYLAELARQDKEKARDAEKHLVLTERSEYPVFLPKSVEVSFFPVTTGNAD